MKKFTGSRFLVVKQLKAVIRETIPKLETSEQAEQLESHIYTARKGGILSDTEYLEMKKAINKVCKVNNWPEIK